MKKIIWILLSLVVVKSYAQDPATLNFYIENGNLKVEGDPTKLKLPADLSFSKDFKDLNISILNSSGVAMGLMNEAFGHGSLTLTNDEAYIIQIDTDGTLNPSSDQKKIGSKFKLKIGSFNPMTVITNKEKAVDVIGGIDKMNTKDAYQLGYMYYDAMIIADENASVATRIELLEAYGIDMTNADNNPYLVKLYKGLKGKGVGQGGLGSFATSLGNTDITYFAAGLARFLAERTKDELNEAFFNRMKEQLNAYPELKTAFPKTASFLEIVDTYSYASILQVLKEAFETDIQNLPGNLYNLKSLTAEDCDKVAICGEHKSTCQKYTSCQDRLAKLATFFDTQEGHWISLGMFTVKEAAQSTNPAELIKSITSSDEFTGLKKASVITHIYDDYNIVSCVELSNYISQSLISQDDNQVWVTTTQLNSLFKTKGAFEVYLGLLLSGELTTKDKTLIDFYKADHTSISFGGILLEAHKTYATYEPQLASLIKNTYAAYHAANSAVKKIMVSSETSTDPDPQALYGYYRTLTSALRPIAYSPILKTITGKDLATGYSKVTRFLDPSVDMVYHTATKKYAAAVYDASILLSAMNTFEFSNASGSKELYKGFKPITNSFLKYGTLISTIAGAQSSEEVKQAMEASVLPVGSYSIKRKTSWSLGVNSYVGAYWSYSNTKDYIPSLGLAAPIGFNISKGFSKTGNCGGLSLNLQILDVGALVNYYLLKGDSASIPSNFNVRLSNVFSPGFNICYNIPKTPLSLAWGGQYIPTLYKYEQINGKNELTPTQAWRFQVSLLVDIPMYNIKVWDFKR